MADFGLVHYRTNVAAAKTGILGPIKSLVPELGVRNICVNDVSPGPIEADMAVSLPEKSREEILRQTPQGRAGYVAAAVAFLASEEAGYITAQILRINGGLYM